MCGITGIFNLDGESISPAVLRKMTDVIAHRGPDGEGYFVDRFVGLGHRRLAIIDLTEAAHQPMQSIDSQYIISYNGEVYNFRELRQELEGLGYCFRSHTDSEVVLNAYAEWGEECLNRFNGMFAFAVWDKRRQELFLARDRYGIKPLYYSLSGGRFLFASEIKAIAAHPDFVREVDKEGLAEYFTFQNFFTDRTLFRSVRMLPAGSYLRIPLGSSALSSPVRYWDYHFCEPEQERTEQEYVDEFDGLFRRAVSRQLVSDVEIGSYLSGGMDSGSITALAAGEISWIKTFTVGFDLDAVTDIELGFDERQPAEHMSSLYQTEHYEMVLKAGDMERAIARMAHHLEEPRVGQSYPNFYAAQLAGKFVKVVLGGTGGDELFGGYPWRYYRAANCDSFDDYVSKYFAYWQRLVPPEQFQQLLAPLGITLPDMEEVFRSVFASTTQDTPKTPEDYVNYSLYLEAKTFLHGLLVVEDKLSMAHSLESRVPFLDNDLVDFAMKLPLSMKLSNLGEAVRLDENTSNSRKTESYFRQHHDGKRLLRSAMQRYIPPSITGAKKQGFSAPDASWFKGRSLQYVRDQLFGGENKLYQFLDRKTVEELVGQHFNGTANRRLLIWSLIYTSEAMQQWFGCSKSAVVEQGELACV